MNTFSKRNNYIEEADITIREDAPDGLRGFIIDVAEDYCKIRPSILRSIICKILKESPDSNNWTDYPNIDGEIRYLIGYCKWYRVYDIIEIIYIYLYEKYREIEMPFDDNDLSIIFQTQINEYFLEKGVGWKLVNGQIEIRGSEPFEETIKSAYEQLESTEQYSTASKELHEAITDLSRRPVADKTGAIQHAIASLECVAREITGESKSTFGKILEKKKLDIPKPLDTAIEKAWGYASEYGRHLQEGRNPDFEEAELIVGISAAISNYIIKKNKIS